MLKTLLHLINTGLYSGLSPKAPGTMGTLMCAFLMYLFWHLLTPESILLLIFTPFNLSLITLVLGLLSIKMYYSNNDSSKEAKIDTHKFDPQEVVIDEFSGYLLTLSFLPPNKQSIIIAFIMFRLFDITKPWPIKFFEKFKSPWGIMLDDLIAGLWGGMTSYLIVTKLLPHL